MQEKYLLSLQENKHPRDLIYELSTFYLTASCYNLAMQLSLPLLIPTQGISINKLTNELPDYAPEAIRQLIEFLALYQFLKVQDDKVYPSSYSDLAKESSKAYQHSPQEWDASYDILQYFETRPNVIENFSKHLIIKIKDHSISYEAIEPDEILNELFYGHLIARAVRFLATSGLADKIGAYCSIHMDRLQSFLPQDPGISAFSLDCLLKLLNRYKIVDYEPQQQLVRPGTYLPYLLEHQKDSINKAMHMITLPWWSSFGHIETSFLREGSSAFEQVNKESFYKYYISDHSQLFTEGMAAISLFDDQDVCDTLLGSLASFETIIDIGGGDGGLLKKIHSYFPHKHYILFEKLPEDSLNNIVAAESLVEKINMEMTLILLSFLGTLANL